MKKNVSSTRVCINLIFSLIIICLFSSCISQRNIEYVQDDSQKREFQEPKYEDYRLRPNDELYIQITSMDEASANIFGTSGSQPGSFIGGMQPYGASLVSNNVDKEGYLIFPVFGKILVKDRTISEVSNMLKDSLSGILNQPIVTVKLVNRFISVLGEVRNPGHFPFSQDKLTIFNALGLAGDISDYGDRSNVILMRTIDNKNLRISLDLTKSSVLASEYYYLRPGDLIYIKPLKKRFWGMKEFPFTIILSTVSTALLIYSVVIK